MIKYIGKLIGRRFVWMLIVVICVAIVTHTLMMAAPPLELDSTPIHIPCVNRGCTRHTAIQNVEVFRCINQRIDEMGAPERLRHFLVLGPDWRITLVIRMFNDGLD